MTFGPDRGNPIVWWWPRALPEQTPCICLEWETLSEMLPCLTGF